MGQDKLEDDNGMERGDFDHFEPLNPGLLKEEFFLICCNRGLTWTSGDPLHFCSDLRQDFMRPSHRRLLKSKMSVLVAQR